ncbi:MAG TPA: hypothetical protein VF069_14725 [Streptosporangiaceae bacterium]
MVQVNVGFDGSPTATRFAAPGNTLKTTGLGNCIAIVAYDTQGHGAAMRHYDTLQAYGGQVPDAVSGGNALTFDRNALTAARNNTRAALLAQAPGAQVAYAVAIGGVWANVDQRSALWQSRHNLLTDIVAVFGFEPTIASGEATWDVTGSRFI